MKTKQTQETLILSHLRRYKKVSRNFALSQRITRLAAIIADLKKTGWNPEGRYVRGKYGKDFVYFVQ